MVKAADQVEERRLPGAGRSHHREPLTLFDDQAQVVQSLHGPAVSVAFGDIGQLDHSRSREYPEMTGQCLKRELILPQGRRTAKVKFQQCLTSDNVLPQPPGADKCGIPENFGSHDW